MLCFDLRAVVELRVPLDIQNNCIHSRIGGLLDQPCSVRSLGCSRSHFISKRTDLVITVLNELLALQPTFTDVVLYLCDHLLGLNIGSSIERGIFLARKSAFQMRCQVSIDRFELHVRAFQCNTDGNLMFANLTLGVTVQLSHHFLNLAPSLRGNFMCIFDATSSRTDVRVAFLLIVINRLLQITALLSKLSTKVCESLRVRFPHSRDLLALFQSVHFGSVTGILCFLTQQLHVSFETALPFRKTFLVHHLGKSSLSLGSLGITLS
mmetsp:Transcript_16857/g.45660  ORF Transcript_16857/g.45660 Transcript_16857/m.45660 type:complete len:266 (-) Transcript_16857:399-1196(-)